MSEPGNLSLTRVQLSLTWVEPNSSDNRLLDNPVFSVDCKKMTTHKFACAQSKKRKVWEVQKIRVRREWENVLLKKSPYSLRIPSSLKLSTQHACPLSGCLCHCLSVRVLKSSCPWCWLSNSSKAVRRYKIAVSGRNQRPSITASHFSVSGCWFKFAISTVGFSGRTPRPWRFSTWKTY